MPAQPPWYLRIRTGKLAQRACSFESIPTHRSTLEKNNNQGFLGHKRQMITFEKRRLLMGPWICRDDAMHRLQISSTDYSNCVYGGEGVQFMMLGKSRGLCGGEVTEVGEHRLDCVLTLQPNNLNSCQLNQFSGLPLGTTPEETEAMPERTPGEDAK